MSNDVTAQVMLARAEQLKHEKRVAYTEVALLRAYAIARGNRAMTLQLWNVFSAVRLLQNGTPKRRVAIR